MGRAFEFRKARKFKRWGNMARVFTKLGKEITICAKQGGPEPENNPRLRVLMQTAKKENKKCQTSSSPAPEEIVELIAESVEDLCEEDGLAHMGKLGNLLLKKQPDFDPRNYGFSKLSKLIRALDRFQIVPQGEENVEYYVRDICADK